MLYQRHLTNYCVGYLLTKIFSYSISEIVFSIIKSSLTCSYIKVVVNVQSPGVHELNVPQVSIFDSTLIVALYKNILRYLMHIYADKTTVYECTSKKLLFTFHL